MNQVTSVFLRPSKCSLSRLHFFLIWIKLIICDHDSCAVFQFQHQDVLPIEHQLRFLALLKCDAGTSIASKTTRRVSTVLRLTSAAGNTTSADLQPRL